MATDDDELGKMSSEEFWSLMSFLLLMGMMASFYVVRLIYQIAHGYGETDALMGDFEDDASIQSLVESHYSFQHESRIMYPTAC
jgi:hypothetical protein